MSNLRDKIEQHKKLFPKATLSSQILKLEEELLEVKHAKTTIEMIKELADCIICCIGIYRFAPETAAFIIKSIMTKHNVFLPEIYDEVECKWEINLHRKWEYKNGQYHHIEELN